MQTLNIISLNRDNKNGQLQTLLLDVDFNLHLQSSKSSTRSTPQINNRLLSWLSRKVIFIHCLFCV